MNLDEKTVRFMCGECAARALVIANLGSMNPTGMEPNGDTALALCKHRITIVSPYRRLACQGELISRSHGDTEAGEHACQRGTGKHTTTYSSGDLVAVVNVPALRA